MAFVVDASVTLAWCFEDETTRYSDMVLDRLRGDEAIVPGIWPFEVINVLVFGERRGRLTEANAARFLTLLGALPILVEPVEFGRLASTVWALARVEHLSSYDAAYLELAMREALPLATQDVWLADAARRVGVTVLR
ncbi:MAG TPA: type II toxin-antitoxin system VapC family toxin [Chloroflexota bacterium]|nr:type II toxin-antitoxin system VapC family toxin [Chloroflexota bacterium]